MAAISTWRFTWAQALVEQTDDSELRDRFTPLANELAENETRIVEELNSVQGQPQDIGGYYFPDPQRASEAMPQPDAQRSAGTSVPAATIMSAQVCFALKNPKSIEGVAAASYLMPP